mmetsp:Transcript_25319/g.34759  ORF Transcript_25319/g.34759 Transcript_25319/m.34759 type:complete len:151 (+) Transcript_25319:499-951(+)
MAVYGLKGSEIIFAATFISNAMHVWRGISRAFSQQRSSSSLSSSSWNIEIVGAKETDALRSLGERLCLQNLGSFACMGLACSVLIGRTHEKQQLHVAPVVWLDRLFGQYTTNEIEKLRRWRLKFTHLDFIFSSNLFDTKFCPLIRVLNVT